MESKIEKREGDKYSYEIALLDPRPNADNSKIFEGKKVYGIEVTIPALAAKCDLGNLDPQHTGGDHTRAAIEDAVSVELPPEDARLVTVRADLDALGSMAIFNIRHVSELTPEILEKVKKVAEMDTFSKGGWPGEKELPTKENPWPEGQSELMPLIALSSDFKVSVADRVKKIQSWLEENAVPAEYVERLAKERLDLAGALERGEIKVDAEDGIAKVETTHRAGMDIGYRKAPIVIALNPKFQLAGGEPHKKYTIAQFAAGYADLKSALEELKAKEEGWGGSPTIIGSPQGVSSKLSMEEVFEIVKKYKK